MIYVKLQNDGEIDGGKKAEESSEPCQKPCGSAKKGLKRGHVEINVCMLTSILLLILYKCSCHLLSLLLAVF